MSGRVKIISKEDLKNLHTGTLMKRRKYLLACEESFQLSDRFGYDDEPVPEKTGYIEFKDTTEWIRAYSELKEVLSTRENWSKQR
jgi:hypothetical protein